MTITIHPTSKTVDLYADPDPTSKCGSVPARLCSTPYPAWTPRATAREDCTGWPISTFHALPRVDAPCSGFRIPSHIKYFQIARLNHSSQIHRINPK